MSATSKSVISAEQAKTIARRACRDDGGAEVVEYHLESYSNHKVGFLGSHQKLEIVVRSKDGEDTRKLKFFVKSVPRDSEAQVEFVRQRRVFRQEAEFFVKLMPRLLETVSVGEIDPWAPECYLANEDVVVLEDVRERGFTMREAKILNAEELKSAVRAMARMHAASIMLEEKLGKPLGELYPQACAEQIFNQQMRQYGMSLTVSLIRDVAKRENRGCAKDLRAMIERAFDFVGVDGRHRVVCHGDAWPNNLMMRDDEPPKCLLVDYQMTRYAPRMFDVAMLLCLSTHRDFKDERSVVKAYWRELEETLRKCLPSIDRPTYEQLVEEYDEAIHSALFIAVMYLPTIMLSEKVFAEYKDDPALLYQKFVFRRNNECILELMDKDKEYARRIAETVLAFVDSDEKLVQ